MHRDETGRNTEMHTSFAEYSAIRANMAGYSVFSIRPNHYLWHLLFKFSLAHNVRNINDMIKKYIKPYIFLFLYFV